VAIYRGADTKNAIEGCWRSKIKGLSKDDIHRLTCSLGNFILVPKNKVLKDDVCFAEKKILLKNVASNIDRVINSSSWEIEQIKQRGMELLTFMEERWNIKIGSDEFRRKILFLDQVPPF
jgi:hypothetical protein